MEWITKALDFLRLPIKHFAWIALLSGLLLWAPAECCRALHVESLRDDHGPWIGLTFAASSTWCVLNWLLTFSSYIIRARQSRLRESKRLNDIVAALNSLAPQETSVLREFTIHGATTLKLPIDSPDVAGLLAQGVLVQVGSIGKRTGCGYLFPVTIAEEALCLLTKKAIGVPEGEPTPAQRTWILDNRPSFAERLDRDRQLFGS